MTKLDRGLSHALSVDLEGLNRFEKAAKRKYERLSRPRTPEEARPVEEVCPEGPHIWRSGPVGEVARAVPGMNGKPPLEAAGLVELAHDGLATRRKPLARS